jgi:hypothetical protein
VDDDERLRITGVTPGRYDQVPRQERPGLPRQDIDVKAGGIFSIEERQVSIFQK